MSKQYQKQKEKWKEQGKKELRAEIEEEIENRIKFHSKEFDRYNTETRVYSEDESQVEYSTNHTIEEMHMVDELEELKQKLIGTKDAGEKLTK